MPDEIHKFELAGLGKAPFRCTGINHNVGPKTVNGFTIGAPGQPMGTCDYCGQGIANEFIIQSADGKRFIVGSDCVVKTGDNGLKKIVSEAESIKRKAANAIKKDKMLDFIKFNENLFIAKVTSTLADQPHPNSYYASQGKTLADYVLFSYNASGSGAKVKLIKKYLT